MKIRIHSFRGDHACEPDVAVAEAIFNKLTGKTKEALPEEIKTKVPDTFKELQELWTEGKMKFLVADESNEMVKEFRPDIQEMLFMPIPIGG